jgi:hypothetical protein
MKCCYWEGYWSQLPDKKHRSIFWTYVEAAALGKGDGVSIPFCNKQHDDVIVLLISPSLCYFEFLMKDLTKVPHYCRGVLCTLTNLIGGKFDILSHGFHQSFEVDTGTLHWDIFSPFCELKYRNLTLIAWCSNLTCRGNWALKCRCWSRWENNLDIQWLIICGILDDAIRGNQLIQPFAVLFIEGGVELLNDIWQGRRW